MGCYNTCIVNAPVDQVWGALRNFHDMSWASGVIEDLKPVGNQASDQVGAKRILNGAFHETLRGLDDVTKEIHYTIDDGPDVLSKDKVSGYTGHVRLSPVTDSNKTFVEWTSSWGAAEGDVHGFCNPIYVALLGALSKHYA